MPHGPQQGSVEALCDSEDPDQQKRGDAAGNLFGRLVSAQLISLTVVLALLTYYPPLLNWVERQEKDDFCLQRTKLMTCLDWGLNVALFLILLPLTLLTVSVTNPVFKWSLWAVWSSVLVLDLALFLAAYSWRNYAVGVCVLMVGFVVVVAALAHLPRAVLLLTWGQVYNWAVKVTALGGAVFVILSQDVNYAWVAIAAPVATVMIVYCCHLILDSCPPEQVTLGSMFVLFPEGLLLALWILKRTRGEEPPLVSGNAANARYGV